MRDEEDGERLEWLAVKNDLKFSATSPEELLGLITMYEHLGDKWREYSDRKFTDEVFEREYKEEN